MNSRRQPFTSTKLCLSEGIGIRRQGVGIWLWRSLFALLHPHHETDTDWISGCLSVHFTWNVILYVPFVAIGSPQFEPEQKGGLRHKLG